MKIVRYLRLVFRTDRSEPNWDRCVTEVKNRFLRFSRDLLVRYRRSWACFDGSNEGYATKKRSPKSDHWIARYFFQIIRSSRVESGSDRQNPDPIRSFGTLLSGLKFIAFAINPILKILERHAFST